MWTLSLLQKTLILTPLCGRAMINIVMTFAQLERETIVERVTDNYYFRANNGYWAGGYAPYGYKIKHIIGSDGKKHSILEIDKGFCISDPISEVNSNGTIAKTVVSEVMIIALNLRLPAV